MRFHHLVEDLFHGRTGIRVMRILVRYPTKEFTGRELARLSGTSPSKAIQELNRLRLHGAVRRRTAGSTQLWQAVPGHFMLEAAAPAFRAEEASLAELRDLLAAGLRRAPVLEAYLFGSLARGAEHAGSDVDLLVVVRRPEDREGLASILDRLGQDVERRFGNPLHAVVYTAAERARRPHRDIVERAVQEGLVVRGRGSRAG